jgi:hypothetical protein
MELFNLSWLAIIAAAVCGFVVGGIWYGPIMGKKWMGAVGLTEEQIKGGNMAAIYGGAFVFFYWPHGRLRIPSPVTVLTSVFRLR